MADGLVPVAASGFGKNIAARIILHGNVQMHPRTCIGLNRFGHETGGDAMRTGLRAHDALEADQVISGLHDVCAVMQGKLILAGGVFRNHGFGLNARRIGAGIDVGKQR